MSGVLKKSLAILEHLAAHPEGVALVTMATELNQLRSACHRTLHELVRHGHVRQMPQRDVYARGMSSMAAPVQRKGEQTTGGVVIAGPSMRLTEARMLQSAPDLLGTAAELALAGQASPLLKSANVGTWGNKAE